MKLEGIMLDRMKLLREGSFVYSYLNNDDFDECGAIKADAEALIDTLRNIRGVRVALILKQTVAGEVRGSLRAKDDDTDVPRLRVILAAAATRLRLVLPSRDRSMKLLVKFPLK